MVEITYRDLDDEGRKAYDDWCRIPDNADKSLETFLKLPAGKKFADKYLLSHGITPTGDGLQIEPEPLGVIPDAALAERIDGYCDIQEQKHTIDSLARVDAEFAETISCYDNFTSGKKVDPEVRELAFYLAQCEARMQMFQSSGRGNYPELLKDNMSSITYELIVNQLAYDRGYNFSDLSDKAKLRINAEYSEFIRDVVAGRRKLKLSPDVVTQTMAVHHQAVERYGEELQQQTQRPTLLQRIKNFDSRMGKKYGKKWQWAKKGATLLATGALAYFGGTAVVAGLAAWRTFKLFRQHRRTARANGKTLWQHLKEKPVRMVELGLSIGTTLLAGGVSLGLEQLLIPKIAVSGARAFSNEAFFDNMKQGKKGKALLGAAASGLLTFGALTAHTDTGHELMSKVTGPVGDFFGNVFGKVKSFFHKDPEPVAPSETLDETPQPEQPSPGGKGHPTHRPRVQHTSKTVKITPPPSYQSDYDKLLNTPEKTGDINFANLMDDHGEVNDTGFSRSSLTGEMDREGNDITRSQVINGFNSNDSGIENITHDDVYDSMDTRDVRLNRHYGGPDPDEHSITHEMRARDTMHGHPYGRHPYGYRPRGMRFLVDDNYDEQSMSNVIPTGGSSYEYEVETPETTAHEVTAPSSLPKGYMVKDDIDTTYLSGQEADVYDDYHKLIYDDNGKLVTDAKYYSMEQNAPSSSANYSNESDYSADNGQNQPADNSYDETSPDSDYIPPTGEFDARGNAIEIYMDENSGQFTADVHDVDGNLTEHREGEVWYDASTNKVTTYTRYAGTEDGSQLGECQGSVTIVQDKDTGHIITREDADTNGQVYATSRDFVYDDNHQITSYETYHQLGDTQTHNFTYDDNGNPIGESIIHRDADGTQRAVENYSYTEDANGNVNFVHHYIADGHIVHGQELFYSDDGLEHRVNYESCNKTEVVSDDNHALYEVKTNQDGDWYKTTFIYDEQGNLTGSDTLFYDKDGNLTFRTLKQGEDISYFDGQNSPFISEGNSATDNNNSGDAAEHQRTSTQPQQSSSHNSSSSAEVKAQSQDKSSSSPDSSAAEEKDTHTPTKDEIHRKAQDVFEKMLGIGAIASLGLLPTQGRNDKQSKYIKEWKKDKAKSAKGAPATPTKRSVQR
ncbi:MAG: hypothetical protein IJ184_03685 [Alphaproteobacteria bacterium]|nr:hypothetical protein [Alphaproteobacteria bacterium]